MEAPAPKKGKGGKGNKVGKGKGGKGGKGGNGSSNKRKRDENGEEKKFQPKSILAENGDGPANKKRALRQQRAATKPNFEAVTAAKVLWNELREKKCPAARRTELCDELHAALSGKYREVALKHDASRLVQAVVLFGSEAQRFAVLEECTAGGSGGGNGFMELCRSPYAHYVVIKLLEQCRSKEAHRKLAASLAGHVVALATHGVAARVIELALGTLKGSVAANLKLELYGREFTVFASDLTRDLALHRQKEQMAAADAKNSKDQKGNEGSASSSSTAALPPVSARPTLAAMLAVRPERADATLTQVGLVVGKLVRKGLLAFQYAHELVAEYLETCPAKQFEEVAPAAVENALVLLSTRAGARAVCAAARRGGAKERRRLLKLLKGHSAALLTHRDAYLAVLALCECTDDTVALQKSLLAELCVEPTSEELAAEKQYGANPYASDDDKNEDEDAEDEEEEEKEGEDEDDDKEGSDDDNKMDEDDEDEDGEDEEDESEAKSKKTKKGKDAAANSSSSSSAAASSSEVERAMPLLSVALNPNGAKLLLRVLSGGNTRFLDPLEEELLLLPAEASKKDPQVRRDELKAFLTDPLLAMVAKHPVLLLQSRSGGAVAAAALQSLSGSGSALLQEAATAMATAVSESTEEEEEGAGAAAAGGGGVLAEDVVAHATLKRALLAEAESEKESSSRGDSATFSSPLASALVSQSSEQLCAWATGDNGSFVAWALLQVPSAVASLKASQKLTELAGALSASAKQRGSSKGQALAAEAANALLSGGTQKKGTAAKATAAAAASAKKAPKTPKATKANTQDGADEGDDDDATGDAAVAKAVPKAAAATARKALKTPVRSSDDAKTPKRAATASKAEQNKDAKKPSPAGMTRSMRKQKAAQ